MEASLLLSALGLTYTIFFSGGSPQPLEGTKHCNFDTIQVIRPADDVLYLKYAQRVHVLYSRPTKTGFEDIQIFENQQGNLSLVHLPSKTMLLDGVSRQTILDECRAAT